jgi:hypothetical protein
MTMEKVHPDFKPMQGCNDKCPIALKERSLQSEICCDGGGRQCCFTCLDIECPIKFEYKDVIQAYDGVLDFEDE